jgi:cyclic pyranopterin phosphate synthase
MPADGACLIKHVEMLSFDEIVEVVKIGVKMGITKIRLTGGEPLVRKDISQLIDMINQIDGIEDIGLTTNGILLSALAVTLKNAGLKRVNISLDTLNHEKYKQITRTGNLDEVLKGIDTSIDIGFHTVKINFVRIKGINEEDEKEVKEFCREKKLVLRIIRQMNIETGEFYPVKGGDGGICHICNRLRLTADGYIKPCLFSDYGFNVKEWGIYEAFLKALDKKPLEGHSSKSHQFYNIGG